MTGPAKKVTEVCDDCDGDGYIGILTDSRMGCMRCDETGFVEVTAVGCRAELCPMWDGHTCPCDTFSLDRDDPPTNGTFTVSGAIK